VSSHSAQCRFLQSGPVCVHAFVRQRSYIERGRFAALRLFQPHWLGDRFYQLIHFSIKFFRWRGSFRYRRSFSFVFDFILLQSDDEKKKNQFASSASFGGASLFFFIFLSFKVWLNPKDCKGDNQKKKEAKVAHIGLTLCWPITYTRPLWYYFKPRPISIHCWLSFLIYSWPIICNLAFVVLF
jgi:hypothetical protein